jgi:uncharacterized membrane protein HdeD (DUF308 family)
MLRCHRELEGDMATADATVRVIDPLSKHWWIVLLEGIALVIIGILLFTDTEQTLFTLVLFLGIWWFISGIFDLVSLFIDRTHWGWKLFSGILGILAGLLIIRHPVWASVLVPVSLVWVLGFFGIVIGIIALIRAFQGAGWGIGILGVISLILGIILLGANMGVALATIIVVGALWAIVGGIVAIVYSFRLRSAQTV